MIFRAIYRLFDKYLADSQKRELQDFVSKLSYLDSEEIACIVCVAADFRNHALKLKGIDLQQPSLVLIENPFATAQISREVVARQRRGETQVTSGMIVWVHTLRAMTYLDLRPLGRELWRQLSRGFPHVQMVAPEMEQMLGLKLHIEGFARIPTGLGDQT